MIPKSRQMYGLFIEGYDLANKSLPAAQRWREVGGIDNGGERWGELQGLALVRKHDFASCWLLRQGRLSRHENPAELSSLAFLTAASNLRAVGKSGEETDSHSANSRMKKRGVIMARRGELGGVQGQADRAGKR